MAKHRSSGRLQNKRRPPLAPPPCTARYSSKFKVLGDVFTQILQYVGGEGPAAGRQLDTGSQPLLCSAHWLCARCWGVHS